MTFPKATISISALQHNLKRVKACAPNAKVMAVIKANAYGHGALVVANALHDADAYAVARLQEAMALRQAGIDKPILLLAGVNTVEAWVHCAEQRIDAVVHDLFQVEQLAAAPLMQPINLWLKADTGMHRLGLALDQIVPCYERLKSLHHVASIGLMTHLACADELSHPYSQQQQQQFDAIALDTARSFANSAAILSSTNLHYDWVRPGIMLYGASPFAGKSGPEDDLRAVMTLQSELVAVRSVKKGETVGYSRTWTCPEDMLVGVVGMGYGDGYPRHAPAGTPVLLHGQTVPLIGRVSMDMLTVDLRKVTHAKVGDPVIFWGSALAADIIADHMGTISYELFCSVTQRVSRIVVA